MYKSTTPDDVTASECPPDEVLVELLVCPTEEARFAPVLQHLAVCSDCRSVTAEAARVLSAGAGDIEAATLQRGALVGGRYRLDGLIGRGGMGEVYRATDVATAASVAVKTLACTRADDAGAARRFEREIRHAASVRHAAVCQVLDFGMHRVDVGPGRTETLPFLVMELLEGKTLADELACGAFALRPALDALSQLLQGLAAIHAAGIIHRDLKCANVFVRQGRERPNIVITDFGLARSEEGRSSTGAALIGSFDYMAPEQLRREPATVASDLYAFGIVAFKVLTGRVPFDGNDPIERAAARLYHDPRRLGDHVQAPAALDDLVSRLLRREPADRVASASEALALLRQLMNAADDAADDLSPL